MATKWTSPTWRMPEESNQSKFENYSLSFDGSEYVIIGSSTEIDNTPSNPYSFSFWFKSSTAGRVLSEKRAANNFVNAQYAIHLESGYIKWYGGADGATGTQTSTTLIDNQWHHIVCVAESTTVNKIYVDGQLDVTSSANRINGLVVAGTFNIGANFGGSYRFVGQLSQYCIFDYALSTTQINYLYNSDTPQNPMAISGNAPIAYYPLGGSSAGSSSSLTIPNESVPSATVFNFDNQDKINITNPTFLDNITEFTISLWYNKGNLNNPTGYILDRGTSNGFYLTQFRNQGGSANCFEYRVNSSNGAKYMTSPANPTNVGEWAHVCLVWNSTNQIIYVNGIDIKNEASLGGTLNGSGNDLVIGNPSTSLFYDLSNCQIWDSTLLPSEITTLYNNGVPYTGTQPQAANLKAWYKMGVDTSIWNGSNWTIGNSTANYSSALNFPSGSSNIVFDSGSLNITSALTVSGWFKIPPTNTGGGGTNIQMFLNEDATSEPGRNWSTAWRGTGHDYVWFAIFHNDGTGMSVNSGNSFTPNDGKWHHYFGTWDGTTNSNSMKLYIDNVLVAQDTPSQTGIRATSNVGTTLGAVAETFSWSYEGEFSNWAVWNSSQLSELSNIYNGGTPASSYTNTPLGWWKLDNTTTGIEDLGSGSNDGTIGGSVTTIDSLVSTLNGTSSGMTTANLVNSDLTRSIPYSSYSMSFDGTSNEYINCGHTALTAISGGSNTLSTSMSVSIWFKLGSSSSSRGLINFGSLGNTYGGFTIRHQSSVFSFLKESTHLVSGGYTFTNTSEWHHMAFVYDPSSASNCYLYIDGADTGVSFANVGNLSFQNANLTDRNLIIGAYYGDADTFTGSISNCSIYNKLLTTNQILTIYNGGVPNDVSSLSPVGWWSLSGDSYFNGNDFKCPDLSSNSNDGTSDGMGGTELVGNGPGSTGNGTATGMNIPANLQGNAPNSTKNAFSINMTADDKTSSVPDISS